ncbi:MAG: hypothetical protein AAB431_00420 [Patescibacteria group bacterium]
MIHKTKKITEWIGWYGVVAILGAYALLSFGILSSNNVWYYLLNLTGGAGIIFDAYAKRDYQPMVLNVIWSVFTVIALARILMNF